MKPKKQKCQHCGAWFVPPVYSSKGRKNVCFSCEMNTKVLKVTAEALKMSNYSGKKSSEYWYGKLTNLLKTS